MSIGSSGGLAIKDADSITSLPSMAKFKLLQTLICKVPASGLQGVERDVTDSTNDDKAEDTRISDVPRGCVRRSGLTFRHPVHRHALCLNTIPGERGGYTITYNVDSWANRNRAHYIHRVSKKTSTHIIGYKLRNSCPILIIFDTKIPHIV